MDLTERALQKNDRLFVLMAENQKIFKQIARREY